MDRLVLPFNIRLFDVSSSGNALAQTGLWVHKDTQVEIGDPEEFYYDHRLQWAAPIKVFTIERGYALVKELNQPIL